MSVFVYVFIFRAVEYKSLCCILYRAHAEYQLNSRPSLPFWLTPAQFLGRLIISKDFKHVVTFKLGVPTVKQLNIGELLGFHVHFHLISCFLWFLISKTWNG